MSLFAYCVLIHEENMDIFKICFNLLFPDFQ